MHRPAEPLLRFIQPTGAKFAAIFGSLAILAMLATFVDAPLAGWLHTKPLPHELDKLLALAEVFGHGLGVILILLTLLIIDPVSRRVGWRLLGASLGSGLLADGLKLLAARTRPCGVDWNTAGSTFAGWMPMLSNGYGTQSFPSSHVATAVGLAIALTWRFGKGGIWFGFLAAIVALQRMSAEAHFLSDVLASAAVAAVVAPICLTFRTHSASN
jgi:membrane-associated phospholipid phosphatase